MHKSRPAEATHYLEDIFGRLYYKRCETQGVWLFWCVNEWRVSNNGARINSTLKPLERN